MSIPFVTKDLISSLYEQYKKNPALVDKGWWKYFEDLRPADKGNNISYDRDVDRALYGEPNGQSAPAEESISKEIASGDGRASAMAFALISAYRFMGWKKANLNPLQLEFPHDEEEMEELEALSWGCLKDFAQDEVSLNGFGTLTLEDLRNKLEVIYGGTIGCEASHLIRREERDFMLNWFEHGRSELSPEEKRHAFRVVSQAVAFENFLHEKYRTAKRFGADGCESLLVILDGIIQESNTAKQVILGMPHRGRLNVMTGIFGKPYAEVFREFEGKQEYFSVSDVKYHGGWSCEKTVGDRAVKFDLLYNPSHLESVDSVTLGFTRGVMEEFSMNCEEVLPILVHGDASVAGQGCVYEMLCMSKLEGYGVGGMIHIVNDNQIGFTAESSETRSWNTASNIAKLCDSPVIHVNADDPESALIAAVQAADYRRKFGKSIFINLMSYRRYGHNEGDEPMFTQPVMYKKIKEHKDVGVFYGNKLSSEGVMGEEERKEVWSSHIAAMQKDFDEVAKAEPLGQKGDLEPMGEFAPTGISPDKTKTLVAKMIEIPEDFSLHKNISRIVDFRKGFLNEAGAADWSLGEALAFASLLDEGKDVRVSGEDSVRGTFSHRHSILRDQETGSRFCTFDSFSGSFSVFNSPLSEEGVMAFEYGYSVARKDSLNIWEAQFGDFANGAQLIIDEYLVSGEEKWNQCSNLTLFLPHSNDGQGPDHSSARIERFLQMCAKDNMRVVYPTTPASLFHLLRSQVQSSRPLVVMTPKSMLRHPECVSRIEDFEGSFAPVIGDENGESAKNLIICSGKVYYDLKKGRKDLGATSSAIFRIEQLYPRPTREVMDLLRPLKNLKRVAWCQEEPMNSGCWQFIKDWLTTCLIGVDLNLSPVYVGRKNSSSPSEGLKTIYDVEQKDVIERAFKT